MQRNTEYDDEHSGFDTQGFIDLLVFNLLWLTIVFLIVNAL